MPLQTEGLVETVRQEDGYAADSSDWRIDVSPALFTDTSSSVVATSGMIGPRSEERGVEGWPQ
jgi:hypothetical protein